MQVHALMTAHVVTLTGIDEEVGLGAGCDTGLEEAVGMLGHNGGVIEADNNLQAALQVTSLVDEAGLGITLGVILRRIHVTLAIHVIRLMVIKPPKLQP